MSPAVQGLNRIDARGQLSVLKQNGIHFVQNIYLIDIILYLYFKIDINGQNCLQCLDSMIACTGPLQFPDSELLEGVIVIFLPPFQNQKTLYVADSSQTEGHQNIIIYKKKKKST